LRGGVDTRGAVGGQVPIGLEEEREALDPQPRGEQPLGILTRGGKPGASEARDGVGEDGADRGRGGGGAHAVDSASFCPWSQAVSASMSSSISPSIIVGSLCRVRPMRRSDTRVWGQVYSRMPPLRS